jgi:hypothetical protein
VTDGKKATTHFELAVPTAVCRDPGGGRTHRPAWLSCGRITDPVLSLG